MNNTMNAAEVMLDTLSAVMGDYAPRKRRLLLDFKDDHGQDRNMDAIVWHNPKTTDETVVRMLKEQLCSDGGRLSAVQTLSRLNRICPPFEKKTFVLDFVNTYEAWGAFQAGDRWCPWRRLCRP